MFFTETLVPKHPLLDVVQDLETFRRFAAMILDLAKRQFIAWDTETSGFDYYGTATKYRDGGARPIGHCVGYDLNDGHGPRGVYFPIRHRTVDRQLPVEAVSEFIAELLGAPEHNIVGHFVKFDLHQALADGIEARCRIHDTRTMAHLLDENRASFKLENLIAELGLDPDPHRYQRIVQKLKAEICKRHDCNVSDMPGFQWYPVPVLGPYGAWDGRCTLLLLYALWPQVAARYPALYDVEQSVLKSIQKAEFRGTPMDVPYLTATTQRLEGEAHELSVEIKKLAGYDINPGNDNDVRELLYEHMRLPVEHYTKKSRYDAYGQEIRTPAVDVVALSYIRHKISSPIVDRLLEFRTLSKLCSTYTRPLIAKCDVNGWLHGTMDPLGTYTGRFSSKEPNLQNMPGEDPKHPERSIRRAFLVPQGKVRVIMDWSQIELRVLAVEAQEPTMLRAFNSGEDLHAQTSMDMFGNVIKTNRTVAKRINFGISYGLTPLGLMNQLNKEADPDNGIPFVTIEEAEGWFEKWIAKYGRVPRYMDDLAAQALRYEPPQYTNEFGRTRRIPMLRALGSAGRRAGRQLVASRIQGGAAELTKVSIVRVQQIIDWARDTGRWEADLALTIHDELQVDVDAHGAFEAVCLFKVAMEDFPQLSAPADGRVGVPVVADAEWTSTNWAEKVSVWP